MFPKVRSTDQSSINMGFALPPITEDSFLECILKVILEGTFNEATTQLSKLHLVNNDWSQMINQNGLPNFR